MNTSYLKLGQKVLSLAKGSRLKHTWISTCGSMANENALKIARQKHSPARKVLSLVDAFAGRTTFMAEISDNPAYKVGLPTYDEVLRIPFYDKNQPHSMEKSLEILKQHIAENPNNISCFCFEPMLGEGGYKVAPREFFIPLFEECKKHNIAIWADEIQTFLRTGEAFAFQKLDFAPYIDLCTVAKTCQCGMTLYTENYNPKPGLIAGTFAGSSSSLEAGWAILEEMESGGFFGPHGKVEKINKEFIGHLKKLCQGSCKGLLEDPEGLGLMVAVTPFSGDKSKILKLLHLLFQKGLIAFGCGKTPFRIRFLVPGIVTENHLKEACKIIEDSILDMK